MDLQRLSESIKRHEGFTTYPVPDNRGWVIGYGWNLHTKGITKRQAEWIMFDIVQEIWEALSATYSWFPTLSDARQNVLVEMGYQMGVAEVISFRQTLGAIAEGDFDKAAREMLDSDWHTQAPERAEELAEIMRVG